MAKTEEAINYYDDKNHQYEDFWIGRDYEHLAEVMAIKRLLRGQHFDKAMDYGGGYGRLSRDILKFADHVDLVDPSTKQLKIGEAKLKKTGKVDFVLLKKKDYVPATDNSLDLLVMVRVSHHLRDPAKTFSEIYRVLKPGGLAIIEVANYAHILHRLKRYARFQKLPKQPVQIGQVANGIADSTPFVNHNPQTIVALLRKQNFQLEKKLSVSNLRSRKLKSLLGVKVLMGAESLLQETTAPINFGPSIFLLVKKPR
jgi:ubiquinone/menaquinone biosynthesis C-methylase UbiE